MKRQRLELLRFCGCETDYFCASYWQNARGIASHKPSWGGQSHRRTVRWNTESSTHAESFAAKGDVELLDVAAFATAQDNVTGREATQTLTVWP